MVKAEVQKAITQTELIKEFFELRPKQDIETSVVADWAIKEYKKEQVKHLEIPVEL